MTKLTRIKFTNMTPLHIGLGRDSYDASASVLQSDMLSAALASVRAMHGKGDGTKEFLEGFSISSAFPYNGNEYFFPRMKGRLAIKVRGMEEKDYRKKLKKLSYISVSLWQQLAKGETIEIDSKQLHEAFLLERPATDYKAPMTHVITERVAVSRTGENDAMPFMFDWTFFKHGESIETQSGLYCLLQANENETQEVVELFNELGTTGIGSDKSVGGGQFSIETKVIDFPDIESDKQMLLSTYIPLKEELDNIDFGKSNYQLIHRGGFMAGSTHEDFRHLRKKTVYMFDTGSVIASSRHLCGNIVDVAPEWNSTDMHPVYRSGRPLSVHII